MIFLASKAVHFGLMAILFWMWRSGTRIWTIIRDSPLPPSMPRKKESDGQLNSLIEVSLVFFTPFRRRLGAFIGRDANFIQHANTDSIAKPQAFDKSSRGYLIQVLLYVSGMDYKDFLCSWSNGLRDYNSNARSSGSNSCVYL